MLLSGALFALFMTGFWVYCLTDAILTPAADCRGLRKQTWVAVISVTFIAGAVAWLIVRRPARDSSVPLLARHPAGRARMADAAPADAVVADAVVADAVVADASPAVVGPDDDVEFMRALGRAIRRDPPVS